MFYAHLSIWIFISLFYFNIKNNFNLNCVLRQTKIEEYYQLTKDIFGEKENFYSYETIFQVLNSSFKNCKLCDFPQSFSLSSPEDLAIAVLYGRNIYNIINWVRTLRSTGCQCKIIFFHELSYLLNFNKEELNSLNECGVVWCNLGVDILDKYKVHPTTTRFLVIQNFLEAYGNYFRSIMINDVFDSLFQKDPFIPKLYRDKIVFSIERVQFGNHDWNMDWVKAIDPNWSNEFWRKKYVINNGFEIGNPNLILQLLYAANKPEYFSKPGSTDQAVVNYLYYRGLFTDLNIDFNGTYYISACYSIFNLTPDDKGFMHEVSYNQTTLALIHQFDRICSVAENLARICKPLGEWHRYPSGRPDYYMQQCNSLFSINNPQTIY